MKSKKIFLFCPIQATPFVIVMKPGSMCPLIQIDKILLAIIKLIAGIICFGLRMITITLR